MSLTPEQINFFNKNGYLLVPDLFSKEEVEEFRIGCLENKPGDSVGRDHFNKISLSPKVINVMKSLMGDKIIYPGLSLTRGNDPVHYRSYGARSFHTDATSEDFDYNADYFIYNTGIYLQDHSTHSGGIKVKPGSHKFRCIVHHTIAEYLKLLVIALVKFKTEDLKLLLIPKKTVNVPSKAGDFVIFSTRTHHSGHAVRIKLFPNLSLPPALENHIPKWMSLPIEKPRCVILTIYTAPCRYLESYLKKQIGKDYRREHYLNSPLKRPDIVELAKKQNVILRDDGYEYYHPQKMTENTI